MTMVDIHSRLANTVILYCAILALWGFWRYFRRQGLDSSFFGALMIGELLVLAQGGLGAYLFFTHHSPQRTIHFLYGIVGAITIPALYAYTHGDGERRDSLIYGAVLLFLVGILFRAITTG